MQILVTGGAASGKSALAESYCAALGPRRCYIATMPPEGPGALERVRRHQDQRRAFRFQTLECYGHLRDLYLEGCHDALLLECMGNVVANERFGCRTSWENLCDIVLEGLEHLRRHCAHLVVVTNEVFQGAEHYQGEMDQYLRTLAQLNGILANTSDVVVEAVCGIPLLLKGELAV